MATFASINPIKNTFRGDTMLFRLVQKCNPRVAHSVVYEQDVCPEYFHRYVSLRIQETTIHQLHGAFLHRHAEGD